MRLFTALALLTIPTLLACDDEFESRGSTQSTGTSLPAGSGGSPSGSASGGAGATGGGGNGASGATGGAGGQHSELAHDLLVVDQAGNAIPDVPIVVHTEDEEIVEVTQTDANGKLVVEIPEFGSVLAFYVADDGAHQVHAIQQPPLGATLRFTVKATAATAATTYDFDLAGYPAGTTTLRGSGPCGSSTATPPAGVTLDNANCSHLASADFLFTAQNASGAPLAWAIAEGLAADPGGTVTTAVDVINTTFVQSTIKLENAPADATVGIVSAFARLGNASFGMGHSVSAPSDNTPTANAKLPTGGPLTHYLQSALIWTVSPTESSTTIAVQPNTSWPATIDVDASTMPRLVIIPPNLANPDEPNIGWESQVVIDADLITATYSWDVGGKAYTWTTRLPNGTISLHLGDLPEELAAFRPGTGSMVSIAASYVSLEGAADYAEAIGQPAAPLGTEEMRVVSATLGAP